MGPDTLEHRGPVSTVSTRLLLLRLAAVGSSRLLVSPGVMMMEEEEEEVEVEEEQQEVSSMAVAGCRLRRRAIRFRREGGEERGLSPPFGVQILPLRVPLTLRLGGRGGKGRGGRREVAGWEELPRGVRMRAGKPLFLTLRPGHRLDDAGGVPAERVLSTGKSISADEAELERLKKPKVERLDVRGGLAVSAAFSLSSSNPSVHIFLHALLPLLWLLLLFRASSTLSVGLLGLPPCPSCWLNISSGVVSRPCLGDAPTGASAGDTGANSLFRLKEREHGLSMVDSCVVLGSSSSGA